MKIIQANLCFFLLSVLITPIYCQSQDDYADLTALQQFAFHGKHDLVLKLLEQGNPEDEDFLENKLQINYRNKKEGMTALYVAVLNGYFDIAEELLNYGADPGICEYGGICPLHLVARKNHLEGAKMLVYNMKFQKRYLEAKDSKGLTPLHYAAYSAAIDVAGFLLDLGANATSIDEKGFTPIFQAIYENNGTYENKAKMLQYFISRGQDICEGDRRGLPIIDYHILHALSPVDDSGAPTDYYPDERFSKKNVKEIFTITRVLLEAGCDPNLNGTLNGVNPIWRVILSGKKQLFDILFLLVRFGADIGKKIQDESGSIFDGVAGEGGDELADQPYIRFIFLTLKSWGSSDVKYWVNLLLEENRNDPVLKSQLETMRKKTKENFKGKQLLELLKTDYKSTLGLSNELAVQKVHAQLEEMKANKRNQKVFSFFWEEVWKKRAKVEAKESLETLNMDLF